MHGQSRIQEHSEKLAKRPMKLEMPPLTDTQEINIESLEDNSSVVPDLTITIKPSGETTGNDPLSPAPQILLIIRAKIC